MHTFLKKHYYSVLEPCQRTFRSHLKRETALKLFKRRTSSWFWSSDNERNCIIFNVVFLLRVVTVDFICGKPAPKYANTAIMINRKLGSLSFLWPTRCYISAREEHAQGCFWVIITSHREAIWIGLILRENKGHDLKKEAACYIKHIRLLVNRLLVRSVCLWFN